MTICKYWTVSGRVQGVWFRASTKTEAEKLGLTGWVKNLPDGRVAVMACGPEAKIQALHDWLKQGPPLANVTELLDEEVPSANYQRFDVL